MGKVTSKEIIKNACYNIITETQKQIVKIITQSTVNVSSTVLQQQIASINSSTDSGNTFTGTNIYITNKSTLNIQQQNQIKVMTGAILNIVQNSNLVDSISSQITNDVMSTVSQNSSLQNRIAAVAQMEQDLKTDGELNSTVNKVTDAVNKMLSLGGSDTEEDIENTIVNTITQNTYNNTDIENYVKTLVNTQISQNTITQCFQSTNTYNITELKNIYISGNSSFNVVQTNLVNNFFSCFVSSSMTSTDLQNIAAGILNSSTTSGSSGSSATQDLASSTSNLVKTIETSFLDNIQYIIIAIVICVVIGGVLLFGTPILLKVLKKIKWK